MANAWKNKVDKNSNKSKKNQQKSQKLTDSATVTLQQAFTINRC